jgi:hypothetical protein
MQYCRVDHSTLSCNNCFHISFLGKGQWWWWHLCLFLVFLSTFNPQHIHRKTHLSQSSNLTLQDSRLLNCLWNTLGIWVIVWSIHGLSCTHILPAILELSNHLCHQSIKHNTSNLLQSCATYRHHCDTPLLSFRGYKRHVAKLIDPQAILVAK